MFTCYVGMKIKETDKHHVTFGFIDGANQEMVDKIIEWIEARIGGEKKPFTGTRVILGGTDLYGPNKDIPVRLCKFDDSENGVLASDIASWVYANYGNHEYPQNLHISANGLSPNDGKTLSDADKVIFDSAEVGGYRIYIKRIGTSELLYSNPPQQKAQQ